MVGVAQRPACKRAVSPGHNFTATLLIDGEEFRMTAKYSDAQIRAGAAKDPDVVMTTSYEPMMALAGGEIEQSDFVSNHVDLEVHTPGKQAKFIDLLTHAIREFDWRCPVSVPVRFVRIVDFG